MVSLGWPQPETGAAQQEGEVPPGGAGATGAAGGGLWLVRVRHEQHGGRAEGLRRADGEEPAGDEGGAQRADRGPGEGGHVSLRRLGTPCEADSVAAERPDHRERTQVRALSIVQALQTDTTISYKLLRSMHQSNPTEFLVAAKFDASAYFYGTFS